MIELCHFLLQQIQLITVNPEPSLALRHLLLLCTLLGLLLYSQSLNCSLTFFCFSYSFFPLYIYIYIYIVIISPYLILLLFSLREETDYLLSKFTWGHAFLELNSPLMEQYSSAEDSASVAALQEKIISQWFSGKNKNSSSSDDGEENNDDDEEREEETEDDSALVIAYVKRQYEEEEAAKRRAAAQFSSESLQSSDDLTLSQEEKG